MPLGRRQRVATVGIAAVATALALAACSSSSSSSTATSSSSSATSSASSSSGAALSGTLNGSGSTFQPTFQEAAIPAFKSVQPGMTVNYGSGGSGKGRSNLAAGAANFAGSDSPDPRRRDVDLQGQDGALLPRRDRPDHGLVQPVRPQQAAEAGRRRSSRSIFEAKITTWNNSAITADQPRGHPAQHRDHHRRPLGFLGHDAELLRCSWRRPRRACGRSAAARPSSGPPRPGPATATAGWRRSSSPPPAPSGTWTTPTPRPPG